MDAITFDFTMKNYALSLEGELFEDMTLDAYPNLELYGMRRADSITFHELEGGTIVKGRFNAKTSEIWISMDAENLKATICHELIHFYEDEMGRFTDDATRQYLTIRLWQKLTLLVDNLDELVEEHMESGRLKYVSERGGMHDLCFFLKSLDIDLSQGWDLGTTFGYGYEELVDDLG